MAAEKEEKEEKKGPTCESDQWVGPVDGSEDQCPEDPSCQGAANTPKVACGMYRGDCGMSCKRFGYADALRNPGGSVTCRADGRLGAVSAALCLPANRARPAADC